MNPRIGLRSTGLVVFSARIISAVTGLVFTVMIGRWLAASQLGLWEYIVSLASIAVYPAGLVSYWATRDVARGRMVGKTAYTFGSFLGLIGIAIYSVITYLTYSHVGSVLAPFVVGSIIVPLSYWSGISGSLVLGYRPVAGGYSLVIGEIAKVAVGYTELYVLKAGLIGVLLALLAAYSVQALVNTYLSRGAVVDKFDREQGKRWLKLGGLPALTSLPGLVLVTDTVFVALFFGKTLVGYYEPAFIVASVVGYSSALTTALYPLLLKGSSERAPSISLDFMLLFAIPMTLGGIVLARPILSLIGPSYTTGTIGLEILCVMFLILSVSGLLDQTLTGTERADESAGASIRRLAGTNLAFIPVVNILTAGAYVGGLILSLSFATSQGLPDTQRVAIWATVYLAAIALFLPVKLRRARTVARLRPGRSVAIYLTASAMMGALVYLLSQVALNPSADATVYGVELAGVVGAGALTYFGLVYALDPNFRKLARSFMSLFW